MIDTPLLPSSLPATTLSIDSLLPTVPSPTPTTTPPLPQSSTVDINTLPYTEISMEEIQQNRYSMEQIKSIPSFSNVFKLLIRIIHSSMKKDPPTQPYTSRTSPTRPKSMIY